MKKYIVGIIIVSSEICENRKCDEDMIEKYLKHHLKVGKHQENLFRGKMVLEIKSVEVAVVKEV